jgi:hypothetical protein
MSDPVIDDRGIDPDRAGSIFGRLDLGVGCHLYGVVAH